MKKPKLDRMHSDAQSVPYPPVIAIRAPGIVPELGVSLFDPRPFKMMKALQKGYELKIIRKGLGSLLGSLTRAALRHGLNVWSCETEENGEKVWLVRLRKASDQVSPFALQQRQGGQRPARGFYRALVLRIVAGGSVDLRELDQIENLKREVRVYLRRNKLFPPFEMRKVVSVESVQEGVWRVFCKEDVLQKIKTIVQQK